MKTPSFIGSNIYNGTGYGTLHPLSILRVPVVMELCRALGWLPGDQYMTSPMAKPGALISFHTPDYLAALQRVEASQIASDQDKTRFGLGSASNPVFREMYRRPATAAGGGLLAAELVAKGGVVFNPGGGTHHGYPDRASGFCYLNEPVVTIRRLLAMGISRVVYVDIDAHHCDGVEHAFTGSEQVRMISVHEERRWPFTGALTETAGGASFNLPVKRGFNDSEFSCVLEELILPAVESFKPDAIFLQCGADAVSEDPLARLCLSNQSHWNTVAALKQMSGRLIVSGGGGYNPWTVGRLWTGVWATLNEIPVPDQLPPEVSEILRKLTWARKGKPDETLLSTLADAARNGPIDPDLHQNIRVLTDRI